MAKYEVTLERTITEIGTVTVEADNEHAAAALVVEEGRSTGVALRHDAPAIDWRDVGAAAPLVVLDVEEVADGDTTAN